VRLRRPDGVVVRLACPAGAGEVRRLAAELALARALLTPHGVKERS